MGAFIERCGLLLLAAVYLQGCSNENDERYINNLVTNRMKRVQEEREAFSATERILLQRAVDQIDLVGQEVLEDSIARRRDFELKRQLHENMKKRELAVMKRLQSRMMQAQLKKHEEIYTAALYATVLEAQFKQQNDYMRQFQQLQDEFDLAQASLLKQKEEKLQAWYREMIEEEKGLIHGYELDRMIQHGCVDPDLMAGDPLDSGGGWEARSEHQFADLALRKYQIERRAHNWYRRSLVELQEELSRNVARLNKLKHKELAKAERRKVAAAKDQLDFEREMVKRQLLDERQKIRSAAEEDVERRYARRVRREQARAGIPIQPRADDQ